MTATVLRRVATLQRGSGFPPEHQGASSGDLPFFKVGDFANGINRRYLRTCENWVPTVTARALSAVVVPAGSTLLPKIGAALLNNARRVTTRPSLFDNNVLAVIPERIESRYLYYWLCMLDLAVLANPGPVPSLNDSALLDQVIPVASSREQRAIADFLDAETARIDALIARRQKTIALLDQRRWAVLTDLVGWRSPMVALRRVLTSITDGPFGSAFASSDYSDEGVAVIRLGNIGFARWRGESLAHLPSSRMMEFETHRVREGDLLIAGLGDANNHAGRACVAPDLGDAIVKGKCFCARVDARLASAEYLALFCSSPVGADAIAVEARGSTRSMINLDIVKSLEIPIPSLESQLNVVAAVQEDWRKSTAMWTGIACQIALLLERRQALITAAVTGELPIPGAAA